MLRKGIEARAFPGASAAVVHRGELIALEGFGRFTYDADSPTVSSATIFDLASLTKVVATTTTAMRLYEQGRLHLERPVVEIVPEFARADGRRKQVTAAMLLAHRSGLPAYVKLYERAHSAEEVFRAACSIELEHEPGVETVYSDIGFIILGELLARVAGEKLDAFCQKHVFKPCAMQDTCFNPLQALKPRIAPTADDRHFRHRVVQGEVQDENASAMGGVSGHAGLFGTARDLARFAQLMLRGGAPILQPETVNKFTQTRFANGSHALGWDTASPLSQSGKYFSPKSVGHLGYTGTSLWIDPERDLAVVLLTNRTWPDCKKEQIKQVRPAFHDAVIEAIAKR